MALRIHRDSKFTLEVKNLIDRTYGRSSLKDSVLERAMEYFSNQNIVEEEKQKLAQSGNKEAENEYLKEQNLEREARQSELQLICHEIIAASESVEFAETKRRSSQLLGTLLILGPEEEKKLAEFNETAKPLYRAVLCLRLLDHLIVNNQVSNAYIREHLGAISGKQYLTFAHSAPEEYQLFVEQVKLPIVMAALLQDIGNYHPDAQEILVGESGDENPYRTLEVSERKKLLQINYSQNHELLI